jgi:hypothetical protein
VGPHSLFKFEKYSATDVSRVQDRTGQDRTGQERTGLQDVSGCVLLLAAVFPNAFWLSSVYLQFL